MQTVCKNSPSQQYWYHENFISCLVTVPECLYHPLSYTLIMEQETDSWTGILNYVLDSIEKIMHGTLLRIQSLRSPFCFMKIPSTFHRQWNKERNLKVHYYTWLSWAMRFLMFVYFNLKVKVKVIWMSRTKL